MKRAAAAASLALIAGLVWLRSREPAPERLAATLPMPDVSRPSVRAPAPGLRASAPPRAAADAPRETAAPEADSSFRAPAAVVAAGEDKESLLDEILQSNDDNDPRLDGAFNGLPLATRRRFRAKYHELPPESRNRRGTIVYLLGKNLDAPEDWAFLREVAGEPPCLGLADCATAAPDQDASEDPGGAVTLAYPALVALKQAERVLVEGGSSAARREALAVVRAGKDSRAPAVAEAAARLEGRWR